MADTYREVKVYKSDKCITRVLRPNITEEERARRYKEIERAAAALIIDAMQKESKKQKENEKENKDETGKDERN